MEPMYPSPCSQPTANSSSWSGVHIHVTAGSPFTSSQTGHSSTTAESACMRPLRFAVVFGIKVRSFLYAHAMQCGSRWQSGFDDALPQIYRDAFAGREPRARGKGRDVFVDVPAVKPCDDFAPEQGVEGLQAHYTAPRRVEPALQGDLALIKMTVIGRRAREVWLIGEAVSRRKVHYSREIGCRHALEYPDRRGLEREDHRTAGAEREITRGFGRDGRDQLDAAEIGPHVHTRSTELDRHAADASPQNVSCR